DGLPNRYPHESKRAIRRGIRLLGRHQRYRSCGGCPGRDFERADAGRERLQLQYYGGRNNGDSAECIRAIRPGIRLLGRNRRSSVVLGAPAATVMGQTLACHGYVFDATTGSLIATLTSPNAQSGGEFGFSVAISSSGVIVGAPGETSSGLTQAGNAYSFSTA